jgi:hypothetical protein
MMSTKRFHEITGHFSNDPQGVTARNFTDQPVIEAVQALQKPAEITGNRGPVIDPTRYAECSVSPTAGMDKRYRETDTSLSLHPAFLSTRAFWESLTVGDVPDRCPACSSRNVAPLFWPDPSLDQYECVDCGALFCWRD